MNKTIRIVGFLVILSLFLLQKPTNSLAMVKNKHRLASLKPPFRAKIEELVEWLEKEFPRGNITIASTFRTFAEQDALYAKGRHVTNARGGQSRITSVGVVIYILLKTEKSPLTPRSMKD